MRIGGKIFHGRERRKAQLRFCVPTLPLEVVSFSATQQRDAQMFDAPRSLAEPKQRFETDSSAQSHRRIAEEYPRAPNLWVLGQELGAAHGFA